MALKSISRHVTLTFTLMVLLLPKTAPAESRLCPEGGIRGLETSAFRAWTTINAQWGWEIFLHVRTENPKEMKIYVEPIAPQRGIDPDWKAYYHSNLKSKEPEQSMWKLASADTDLRVGIARLLRKIDEGTKSWSDVPAATQTEVLSILETVDVIFPREALSGDVLFNVGVLDHFGVIEYNISSLDTSWKRGADPKHVKRFSRVDKREKSPGDNACLGWLKGKVDSEGNLICEQSRE